MGVIQGSGAGGYSFLGRDVSGDPPASAGIWGGGVPAQDCATDQVKATPEKSGWDLVLLSAGYGNAGSGI